MSGGVDPDVLLARIDALLGVPLHVAPADEPEVPAQAPAPIIAARRGPIRILLADDNRDYRRVVKALLNTNGYEILEAKDGSEGLQLARKGQVDLLLLDFDMPGLNGYEVLQELRRHEETRKLPVILVTGAAKRRHLHELGMDVVTFLEKPVPNEVLLAAVTRTLGTNPPIVNGAVPAPQEAPDAAPPAPSTAGEEGLDEGGDEMLLLEEQRKEPEEDQAGLDVLAADSPIVNRVNRILVRAVELGASDIHIEPQEHELVVRVRVDGSLRPLCRLPVAIVPQVVARIKIMSNLVITERRRPQDGQVRATIKDRKIEFRVSTIPSIHGEKVVLRILGGASLKPGTGDLGLSLRDHEATRRALESPHGLLLVTGPTGSGKTTTLYTMLREINKPEYNIMTAEDPVEYELAGLTQVQIKPHIGLTFESVLRSFLRQDPDIMLVGEIRDLETAEIAVKAAITGHLVLSTLHTNSAPGTIMRLTHMGVAPHLVADSVKIIIAQRLVRKICPKCRAPAPAAPEVGRLIGKPDDPRLAAAQSGQGCAACDKTGYKGRMPIFEVMEIRTPEMRQLILASASVDQMAQLAVKEGMQDLKEAALDAVGSGQTSVDEALSILLSE
jgi:type IV pilus assembly protein PilB